MSRHYSQIIVTENKNKEIQIERKKSIKHKNSNRLKISIRWANEVEIILGEHLTNGNFNLVNQHAGTYYNFCFFSRKPSLYGYLGQEFMAGSFIKASKQNNSTLKQIENPLHNDGFELMWAH